MATHAASGAEMPNPESGDFDGPEQFAAAVFEKNAEDGAISKDRFIGLGHCLFQLFQEQGEGPERDIKRMIRDMAGPFAEKEKCKNAAQEIVANIGSEVIPFVAGEVFDWMDRDQNKGVCQDELNCAITAAMEGPAAAFGMIFQALDKDKSGSLSAAELSEFFARLVGIGGKCALVFINTFSSTFKDDMADGAAEEVFGHLDSNEDGLIEKGDLEDMLQGLTMMKEQVGMMKEQVSEMGEGPEAMIFQLMTGSIDKCKAAGDVNPEAFFDLFDKIMNEQIDQFRALTKNVDALPVPPEIVEKFMPFVETAITALQAAFKENMKAVTDAYFTLLDANSDGIVSNSELMAVAGIFDADTSAQDTFDGLFAMVDTDGDGNISKAEFVDFIKKVFDLVVCSLKNAVSVYQAIINAVAAAFFKFFIEAIAGGGELSEDKFTELAAAFAEDGPEVLMQPLMM